MSMNHEEKFTVSFHQDRKEDILLVAINQEATEIIKNDRKQVKSKHEGVRHNCTQCNYQATEKGNLTKHMKHQHN